MTFEQDLNPYIFMNADEDWDDLPYFHLEGEPDMRETFFSKDAFFHEWCLDYFRYCWYGSDIFLEHKLKE